MRAQHETRRSLMAESYLDAPTPVTVLTKDLKAHLHNLTTNEIIDGVPVPQNPRNPLPQEKMQFKIEIPPHSFAAFAEELQADRMAAWPLETKSCDGNYAARPDPLSSPRLQRIRPAKYAVALDTMG